MEKIVIHKASSRGHANHGWLQAHHSFSFAGYYDAERMHYGVLRVLNDDIIAGGKGFGMHPHDNMEIVTIPLQGALAHTDNLGNSAVIKHGDVQVMSAGTGIMHSEYNADEKNEVRLLQIWLFPDKRNVTPRYDQITLSVYDRKNKLQQIVSPSPTDDGVWIHQQAWFSIGDFENGITTTYKIKLPGNGLYAFVIEGTFSVNGKELHKRDAIGISGVEVVSILSAADNGTILLMDVPL